MAGAALAIAALFLPVAFGPAASLTSDESLYLAEGYAIASGEGPRYPSGDFVHHRAPLFPALLAVPIKLTGDPFTAYWVPRLAAVVLAGITFLVARQMFGPLAGATAALLVSVNAFLRYLGTTLFLDGVETLFLMAFLGSSWRAFESGRPQWWALAGSCFAAAFLTKESAIQWLPLPLAFALLSSEHRTRAVAAGLGVFYGIACVALTGWWVWVYTVTGRVYFWGYPDERLGVWLGAASVAVAACLLCWATTLRFAPRRLPALARAAGLALVGASVAIVFYHMEYRGGWPFPHDYVHTVPRYLWEVARPDTEPWPLIVAAVAWVAVKAPRHQEARLLALALVLYLPFGLLVANRWLQQRDLLPMMYLAYVAVGGLVADAARRARIQGTLPAIAVVAAAGYAVFASQQTKALLAEQESYDSTAVTQDDWDNPLTHDLAEWISSNIPAGAPLMSSRLYYSHLYVLDRGQHPIVQLPTVRVEPRPGETPLLRPMSTMFRWEDHRMRPQSAEPRWLYVVRYPVKRYYIALSEWDLLRDIRERGIQYVVLTGEDAGYSSLSYLDYFLNNPGFTLVHRDERSPGNAAYVFRVDRSRLAERAYQARTTMETLDALAREWPGRSVSEVAAAIGAGGIAIRPVSAGDSPGRELGGTTPTRP